MDNLFIIGSPRSGTTFLAGLLKPTRFGEPFETQFILKYYEMFHEYGDISVFKNLQKLVEDINNERAILQWGIKLDVNKIYKNLDGAYEFRVVVDQICSQLSASKNISLWGDKTPHYILQLDKLLEVFPDAKFIYIVRDGRDVALSLLRKKWGPSNIYTCAKEWKMANEQYELIDFLQKNKQLIKIHYENLVTRPIEECSKIYGFIGEDSLSYNKEIESLTKNTLSSNFNKWTTKLSPFQQKIYEAEAHSCLQMHGYITNYPDNIKINFLLKIFFTLHNQTIYLLHMIDQNLVDFVKIKFFNKEPFGE